jgi:hypothetical protein
LRPTRDSEVERGSLDWRRKPTRWPGKPNCSAWRRRLLDMTAAMKAHTDDVPAVGSNSGIKAR